MAVNIANVCRECGKGIKHTGSRGRPRQTHARCAERARKAQIRAQMQKRLARV